MLTYTPCIGDIEVYKLKKKGLFLPIVSFILTLAFLDFYLFHCLEITLYNKVFGGPVDMGGPRGDRLGGAFC